MSVQLEALADEVFDAAAALDLAAPSGMRNLAAPGEMVVAMVQAFTENSSLSGRGKGAGFTFVPVQDANTPQRFYLAYLGHRAVAQVGLFQHRSSGYLHALFTRPDFRRQGAGSFLTAAMSAEARAMGCERVVLQCARDTRLPAYFERLGFRVVGERLT